MKVEGTTQGEDMVRRALEQRVVEFDAARTMAVLGFACIFVPRPALDSSLAVCGLRSQQRSSSGQEWRLSSMEM
jgi:hypothetical protein